jgi:hypothetical protein
LELHHFRGAGAVMFCSSGDSGSNPWCAKQIDFYDGTKWHSTVYGFIFNILSCFALGTEQEATPKFYPEPNPHKN